jgi:serine/threonine protein kinase/tetratricopeptide (TPR) repeat protein
MSLVDLALAQPPHERRSYLRTACNNDPELMESVWKYVESEERMAEFLLEPVVTLVSPEQYFEPKQLLKGRFEIVRKVAQGGMGTVYEALDRKLNKRIALKCARPGFSQQLSPEVFHAQEIAHTNVCKIFEIHTITVGGEDVDFITMEFLDGLTLGERLKAGALPKREAQVIAAQICAGLAEAHRQHVIHGDLKSNNVILARAADGLSRAVITDFGMARQAEALRSGTAPWEEGGTPYYMAPELKTGGKASTASDVYAFGILLSEIMSGQRPFPADLPVEKRENRNLPSAGSKWDGIVSRCLNPDPKRRFASAVELKDALAGPSRRAVLTAIAASAATLAMSWISLRADKPSVAVIPFTNPHGAAGVQYLSGAISEGLINDLSRLPDLKVIARTSSSQFSKESVDIRKVARTLGVHTLVMGRVYQQEGHIRIKVELVREDGTAIWGAEYSPAPADLNYLQAQISGEIAQHLLPQLSRAERDKLYSTTHVDPAAFELFLKGRYQMQLYTPKTRPKAASYFEKALAIDPGFALANAELADCYRRLAGPGILEQTETMALAEKAALRAIALDGDMALAHAVLADIKKDRWDRAGAMREYRRAVELGPSLGTPRVGMAICLSEMGKDDEAVSQILRARELDPISTPTAIDVAAVFYNVRRYDQALATLTQIVASDPNAPSARLWRGIVYGAQRKYDQAIEAFEAAGPLGDTTASTRCYYVFALARSNKMNKAIQELNALRAKSHFIPPSSLAIAYTGLGERDKAMEWLEAGYRTHDPLLQYITVEAHFDDLREDKRFQALLAKMGLPDLPNFKTK